MPQVPLAAPTGSVSLPALPRAGRVSTPSWLDPRLVLGVLLVLVSVVVGSRLVAGAADEVPVLTVTRDLSAGAVLTDSDLGSLSVRLGDGGPGYLDARGAIPVGRVLTRSVAAGELLPRSALAPAQAAPALRLVTVPVASLHAPPPELLPQQQVDVFATYDGKTGTAARTDVVLRRVAVDRVLGGGSLGGAGADRGVVLRVPPGDVSRLVAALQTASMDLVLVLPGSTGDVDAEAAGAPGLAPTAPTASPTVPASAQPAAPPAQAAP